MSMAIAHFAVGVSCATVFLLLTGWYRSQYHTFPLFVGGVLGFTPDIHLIAPSLIEPYLSWFHSSIFANLFLFHNMIDQYDVHNTESFAAVCLSVMSVLLAVMWTQMYALESEQNGQLDS